MVYFDAAVVEPDAKTSAVMLPETGRQGAVLSNFKASNVVLVIFPALSLDSKQPVLMVFVFQANVVESLTTSETKGEVAQVVTVDSRVVSLASLLVNVMVRFTELVKVLVRVIVPFSVFPVAA